MGKGEEDWERGMEQEGKEEGKGDGRKGRRMKEECSRI